MTARSARHFREFGRARRYRSGSRRRLQRIRIRDNWSPEAILFLVSMLIILMVVIPWLVRHAVDDSYAPDWPAYRAVH